MTTPSCLGLSSEAVSPAVPGEVPIVEQAILEPSMGRRAGAENATRALRSVAKHRNAYWHRRLCGIRDEDSCNRERPNTPFTGYRCLRKKRPTNNHEQGGHPRTPNFNVDVCRPTGSASACEKNARDGERTLKQQTSTLKLGVRGCIMTLSS